MKRILLFFVVALMSATMVVFAKADKQTVKFYVKLHCDDCINTIMKNVGQEKGVKDIVCNLADQTALVTYDANKTTVAALQDAFLRINKPAYTSKPKNWDAQKDDHEHDHEHHEHGHKHDH